MASVYGEPGDQGQQNRGLSATVTHSNRPQSNAQPPSSYAPAVGATNAISPDLPGNDAVDVVLECVYASTVDITKLSSMSLSARKQHVRSGGVAFRWLIGRQHQPELFERLVSDETTRNMVSRNHLEIMAEASCAQMYVTRLAANTVLLNGSACLQSQPSAVQNGSLLGFCMPSQVVPFLMFRLFVQPGTQTAAPTVHTAAPTVQQITYLGHQAQHSQMQLPQTRLPQRFQASHPDQADLFPPQTRVPEQQLPPPQTHVPPYHHPSQTPVQNLMHQPQVPQTQMRGPAPTQPHARAQYCEPPLEQPMPQPHGQCEYQVPPTQMRAPALTQPQISQTLPPHARAQYGEPQLEQPMQPPHGQCEYQPPVWVDVLAGAPYMLTTRFIQGRDVCTIPMEARTISFGATSPLMVGRQHQLGFFETVLGLESKYLPFVSRTHIELIADPHRPGLFSINNLSSNPIAVGDQQLARGELGLIHAYQTIQFLAAGAQPHYPTAYLLLDLVANCSSAHVPATNFPHQQPPPTEAVIESPGPWARSLRHISRSPTRSSHQHWSPVNYGPDGMTGRGKSDMWTDTNATLFWLEIGGSAIRNDLPRNLRLVLGTARGVTVGRSVQVELHADGLNMGVAQFVSREHFAVKPDLHEGQFCVTPLASNLMWLVREGDRMELSDDVPLRSGDVVQLFTGESCETGSGPSGNLFWTFHDVRVSGLPGESAQSADFQQRPRPTVPPSSRSHSPRGGATEMKWPTPRGTTPPRGRSASPGPAWPSRQSGHWQQSRLEDCGFSETFGGGRGLAPTGVGPY